MYRNPNTPLWWNGRALGKGSRKNLFAQRGRGPARSKKNFLT